MPTYEYRCPAGHTFDRFMKMSESVAELPCPDCGATAARQVSGGAGLVFKGSGFYLTDYGRNAHRTTGPANAASTSGGGEGKASGEAKPASEKGTGAKGTTDGGSKGTGSSSGGGAGGGGSSSSSSSSGSSSSSSNSGGSGGSGSSSQSGS